MNISVIAYGQRNGKTPAVIHNITPMGTITIDDHETLKVPHSVVLFSTIQCRLVQ